MWLTSLGIVLSMFYLVNAYIETTVWFIRQRNLIGIKLMSIDIGILIVAPLMWPWLRWIYRNDEELRPGWPGDFDAWGDD